MTARPPAVVIPAAIGRRAAAYAIDVAIACGIIVVLIGIAAAIILPVGGASDTASLAFMLLAAWVVIALAALTWALVYTAMQAGHGSIGQRALRLRLYTDPSGGEIGFGRALLRNIVWALAASILVGYFTPLFDASGKRQGWHDKIANAVVGDRLATAAAGPTASEPPATPITAAPAAPAVVLPVVPPPPPRITSAPSSPRVAASRPTAVAATGMISHVPGITQDPDGLPARQTQSEASPRTVAPVVAVVPTAPPPASAALPPASTALPSASVAADEIDETRAAAPAAPAAQRAALYPEAPVLAVLTWDDGSRMAVYGRTVYGRNPAPEDAAVSVAVRDETLSLSKTHFEIGGDPAGVWVIDRHSTNGTVLVRDGGRHDLIAGVQTALRPGDRLEFGDRSAAVGGAS